MAKKDGQKGRSKPERFEVEQTMSAADAAAYFESLARGLREGSIVLGDDGNGFTGAVDGNIDLEVAARTGKRKSRVELTLAFRAQRGPASQDGDQADSQPANPATIPDEMSF